MSQVERTTNDLIINALYLTGELGVGETPDAFMLSTGIELLNELIDKFSADSIYIPFLTTVEFIMVPDQARYSVSDMVPADITEDRVIDISMANFTVNSSEPTSIVYPIRVINKAAYYGVVRTNQLNSRPGFVFLDKQPELSYITFYPAPDRPYPCTLQLKVMLNKLEPFDNLNALPPYYYGFLKYALGRKFNTIYPSAQWPQWAEEEYQDYYKIAKAANETDVTIRPSVILDAPLPFYWPNILAY